MVCTTPAGARWAVAQEAGFRAEIARDSAVRTVMPLLILVPVLPVIIGWLVRGLFRPIAVLAHEVDRRAEQALQPIEPARVPVEVRPFVVAINRLLARVGQAMAAQRRFVADAAHELRSPLTALSLQAERLADAGMPDRARERLAALRQGIERARSLLNQLLTLARVQSQADPPRSAVSILAVYRRVLEDLMPLAEARRIDIGVEGERDAQVRAGSLDLTTVVKNLVDNAIRHTPEGGRIDLSVAGRGGQVALTVRDTGPGIAEAERARVFHPFYRPAGSAQAGSGLGLAIVKTIADRYGARVALDFADQARRSGLDVTVVFPAARDEA
jgi:two-component system OmpR family sensor kinase